MNDAVNPVQSANTNSFASNGIPSKVTDRSRNMIEARHRGNTKAVNEIASNLALSNNPEPKEIKPLVRKTRAEEYVPNERHNRD